MVITQAWNIQTNTDLSLSGPVGQVYAMVAINDMLFAGTQVPIYMTSRMHILFILLFYFLFSFGFLLSTIHFSFAPCISIY